MGEPLEVVKLGLEAFGERGLDGWLEVVVRTIQFGDEAEARRAAGLQD